MTSGGWPISRALLRALLAVAGGLCLAQCEALLETGALTDRPDRATSVAETGADSTQPEASDEAAENGDSWNDASGDGSPAACDKLEGSALGVTATPLAASDHACALTSSGTVECWGKNDEGQLGNGMNGPETCLNGTPCSTTPVAVSGLAGVAAVTTGRSHTCALLSDGTVNCWGSNSVGQLGNGTNGAQSSQPLPVTGLTGVTAIAAGGAHTCALLSAGTVECWGNNQSGELGIGTTAGPQKCGTSDCAPTPVATCLSAVTALSAGENHTCALLGNGAVRCWGDNTFGQLGDGTMTTSPAPVAVPPPRGMFISVSAGFDHTCAVTLGPNRAQGAARSLWCWGNNGSGQLGTGNTSGTGAPSCKGFNTCFPTPQIVTGSGGVIAAAAGTSSTCALFAGAVECWGWNAFGQLGNGSTIGSLTPLAVSGLTGVSAIAVGGTNNCALLTDGGVECWGFNEYGALGDGTTGNFSVPDRVSGF